MAKWTFTYFDNGGGRQFLRVTAGSKSEAIEKGTAKAKKKARGDCINWDCKLLQA